MSYLTVKTYKLDGKQIEFAVPMTYIKAEYVVVYKQAPSATGYIIEPLEKIAFTWINDGLLRLLAPVPAGYTIVLRRETYADTPLVDFQDASILVEDDLDLAALQALHVAQEAKDFNGSEIADATRNLLQAAEDVKDAADRTEEAAAQVEYNTGKVEKFYTLTLEAKNIAVDAQHEAEQLHKKFVEFDGQIREGMELLAGAGEYVAEKTAEAGAAAGNARLSADRAEASAVNSATHATTAKTHADAARTSAQTSAQSALAADAHQQNAQLARDGAIAARDKADDHAEEAYLWANEQTDVVVKNGEFSAKHWAKKTSGQIGLARKWANEDHGVIVEDADYSAKHWSVEAERLGAEQAERAFLWAQNPPGIPVEGDRYSARHYADVAAAVSNLDEHVKAEDPHPQYVRKDRNGSAFFEVDASGDAAMRENVQDDDEDVLYHLDAYGDITLKP